MKRLLSLAIALLLVVPAVAAAQTGIPPVSPNTRPAGFTTTAAQAAAAAERTPQARALRREHPKLLIRVSLYGARWQVGYYVTKKASLIFDVSSGGTVLKTWSGLQAVAPFTREGFAGRFGKASVFIPFALLFLLPFLDPRRPGRRLHFDLLALLALMVPFGLIAHGHSSLSIWTLYGLLGYLLARCVRAGRGRRPATGRAVPWMPTAVLAIGLVALIGGRVALNVTNKTVVDVGYTSLIGADRAMHGLPIYVDDSFHGDTYGPMNYVAYVPFEAVFPFHGGPTDTAPAAHAAAIAFDLLTIVGLIVLGMKLRAGPEGRRFGLTLAWAFAAFPLTLFNLMQNSNDGLVAMLLVWCLVCFQQPALRGAMLGLAASAKFFPGALVGALWRGRDSRSSREMVLTAAASAGVFIASVALYLPAGGLREFYNCTLGFQLTRPTDYSVWSLYPGLHWLQLALAAAVVVSAIAVGFVLRGERTVAQVAGLMGAIVIGLQIIGGHWFFFYVVWFTPLVLVAVLPQTDRSPGSPGAPDPAQAGASGPVAVHA